MGPSWQKNPDGSWNLPRHTLGWQIAAWCSKWMKDPGDPNKPFIFTSEQLRLLLWWYAVDKATGRFTYRTGVLQRMKGWGKDPLLAVICLVELLGPSRLAGWDEDNNQPIGKPVAQPLVQVAAVSQEQGARNTGDMIVGIMSKEMVANFGIKPGVEMIRALEGRARIEFITSNYRSLEGKRSTFVVQNETHNWVTGNNGHKMFEVIDGNATKVKGRYLAITNAYLPGEDSVAERMRAAYERMYEAGDLPKVEGPMYDSVEASAATDLSPETLRQVIPLVRGDSVWLDPESIIASIISSNIDPARSRRMWLNQIVAESDSLVTPQMWDLLKDEKRILRAGDEITLGFDGGKTDDATALVAWRIKDRTAFVLGLWEAPGGELGRDWSVPRAEVDSAVHEAFRLYNVRAFFADVNLWESHITDWTTAYGSGLAVKSTQREPIAFDMRTRLSDQTKAHERLLSTIFDQRMAHNGDLSLRRHVVNTKRRNNRYGVSFGKDSRESKRKIDLYAAMFLAHEAAYQFTLRGKTEKQRSGKMWAF